MIKGDTGLEDVASEGRVKSSVLLGSLRGDHPGRLGLRDATLDGGNGERRTRIRTSRVKNDFMVSEQSFFFFFHKNSFVHIILLFLGSQNFETSISRSSGSI